MGPLDLLNHLINFLAPAAWLALLVPLLARLFIRNRAAAPVWYAQAAINFVVSLLGLAGGVGFFGHDAKMLTYTAMALLCATSQWLMLRGWRT